MIGGCLETAEAAFFAVVSALKLGAFMTHVFCTKDAALVIKGYCPEIVVHPILCESHSIKCWVYVLTDALIFNLDTE